MEINDKPVQSPRPTGRASDASIDFTRPNRDGIEKFRETFEPKVVDTSAGMRPQRREADRIELSEEAQKLAANESGEAVRADEQRKARLDELRAQHLEGRLNTHERIERAAGRMLGAD